MNSLVATSGFAVLGFVLPPILLMSLASLALVTMRRGGKEGLILLLGCVALFGSMTLFTVQAISADLVLLTVMWSLAWVLAMVYRRMLTPSWMINAAGMIGLLCVAGIYLKVSDPAAYWQMILVEHLKPVLIEQQLLQSGEALDSLLVNLSRVMTGVLAAMLSVVLIVSLLLARWWQAMLYNPGGFRQEFYALKLGRIVAVVLIVLMITSLFGQYAISTDMATVVWLLFFFQGLAVLHSLIGMTGMGVGWLVGFYLLLAIVPNYASPVISGLGLVDAWYDFRRRVPRKSKPDNTE